jgi:hypothetical protein
MLLVILAAASVCIRVFSQEQRALTVCLVIPEQGVFLRRYKSSEQTWDSGWLHPGRGGHAGIGVSWNYLLIAGDGLSECRSTDGEANELPGGASAGDISHPSCFAGGLFVSPGGTAALLSMRQ